VTTEDLFMEVVFVVIQPLSNWPDLMVEDMSQFKGLDLIQKCLNAVKKGGWRGTLIR
jgi:hypothetical protein